MSGPLIRPVGAKPLVEVKGLSRIFDVSKPWLNRMIEREPRLLLKIGQRFPLVERMIPEGHRIGASLKEFLADRPCDAKSSCSVFAIDDDEIETPTRF